MLNRSLIDPLSVPFLLSAKRCARCAGRARRCLETFHNSQKMAAATTTDGDVTKISTNKKHQEKPANHRQQRPMAGGEGEACAISTAEGFTQSESFPETVRLHLEGGEVFREGQSTVP